MLANIQQAQSQKLTNYLFLVPSQNSHPADWPRSHHRLFPAGVTLKSLWFGFVVMMLGTKARQVFGNCSKL